MRTFTLNINSLKQLFANMAFGNENEIQFLLPALALSPVIKSKGGWGDDEEEEEEGGTN
jgi:hypothetical protein